MTINDVTPVPSKTRCHPGRRWWFRASRQPKPVSPAPQAATRNDSTNISIPLVDCPNVAHLRPRTRKSQDETQRSLRGSQHGLVKCHVKALVLPVSQFSRTIKPETLA